MQPTLPQDTPSNHSNEFRYAADDEIDLIELGAGLWARRWLIAAVTAGFTVLAGLYALVATPTYEAVSELRPVTKSAISSLTENDILTVTPQRLSTARCANSMPRQYDGRRCADPGTRMKLKRTWIRNGRAIIASRPRRQLASGMGKPATTTHGPASRQNTATRKQRPPSPIPWWI